MHTDRVACHSQHKLSTRLILTSLLLGATLITQLSSSPALARPESPEEVYAVRYSYERLTKVSAQGLEKRYVLMPQPIKVPLKDYQEPKARYRALFDALKADKSSNYGKTGFNVAKDDSDTVLIFLDAKKKVNHPFLIAEAVYTFTDAGAKGVRFPKSSFKGRLYTKSDVSYPVYQLTLPYWEGLPPESLSGGLLSFPDGTLVTSKALSERLKAQDPELLKHMNETLKVGELDAVTAIVKASEQLRANGAQLKLSSGLIPLLSSASKAMRLLALRGLKGIDEGTVNQKLREVMDDDPDPDVQAQASAQLSESKDPKFAEAAQFFALRSKSPEAIKAAARGLATAKTKEATPKLIEALSHKLSEVRTEIIAALVKRRALKELAKTLKGELGLDAKIDVAVALSQDKSNALKEEAYSFLTRQPQGEAAANAARALGAEKKFKPALSLLSELCKHPEAVARVAALETLNQIGGQSALKAVAQADIQDPESGELAHDTARSIYGELKSKDVMRDAQGAESLSLKSAAAGALGVRYQKDKRSRKKLFSLALSLLKSEEPLVRAGLARSFGDIESDEAKAELLKLSQDDAIEVKRIVAFAWRHYNKEEATPILKAQLDSEDERLLVNALDSLGLLGAAEEAPELLAERFLSHKSAEVRRAAVGALAALAPQLEGKSRAALVAAVSLLIKDADEEVQLRAARALGASPNSDSEFALAANFESGSPALTLAIIDALVAHSSVSAIDSLSAVVEINQKEARQRLYQLEPKLKGSKLRAALKKILTKASSREQDDELKGMIERSLKAL